MKIVVVPDSFKGSLSAAEAAAQMAAGVRSVFGDSVELLLCPMADGGEGTLDAIAAAWGIIPESIETVDAIGRPKLARCGVSADGRHAVIEAAEANGLPAVSDVALQPLRADTYGVGLIAVELVNRGVTDILMCVGGSATTDGGTGILTALGVKFLASDGTQVTPGGGGLNDIVSVDASFMPSRVDDVSWSIAVDVDNPLCGARGAAATFGPQKGATSIDVEVLDAGLANLAHVLQESTGVTGLTGPGYGAAGGMPVAMAALLGARLERGSTLVAAAVGLPAALEGASVVFTGEGSFDEQSLGGKVVSAVVAAVANECPVIVIAGRVLLSAQETQAAGVAAAFSIASGPSDLETLVATAALRVRETTAQACGLLSASNAPTRSRPQGLRG
jgi:glycerate kinase